MRVWLQNPFDNLPGAGFRKQRYWLMAEAFVRAGHEVTLWTSDFSHATKTRREMAAGFAPGFAVRLVPTAPYRDNISFRRIWSHVRYARTWEMLARREADRPDLIVTSFPTISAASAALRLGRFFSVPVVVDVQDAWPETFERLAPKGLRWLARLTLTPLRMRAQRIYREADQVTGVCDTYRQLTGREDFMRAYLGIEVETDTREAGIRARNSERIRLVYAGGLGRTYDLKTLAEVVEANKEMTLDVAGYGAFKSDCPRIRFHGMLSATELKRLFSSCDLGVIPMADESCVGLPNKIFDYAAAGLGIVSSLGGESAALLKQYGCGATYRQGDGASLTAAIRQAMATERGASRTMCEREFDAVKIYDAYVAQVVADKES